MRKGWLLLASLATCGPLLVAGMSAGTAREPPRKHFLDGNQLREMCRQSLPACRGYVMGALDQDLLWTFAQKKNDNFCWPPNVDSGQIADVVVKYLDDNPAERHYSAASLALVATMKAFPCP
jgi:hypothetical protein